MSNSLKFADFFKYDRATGKAKIIITSPEGYWVKEQAIELLEGSGFKSNSIHCDGPCCEFTQVIPDVEKWRDFIQGVWGMAQTGELTEKASTVSRVSGVNAYGDPVVMGVAGTGGYFLECVYIAGKLKVRPHAKEPRLDHDMYCQFPVNLRIHGAIYEVETITPDRNGKFYRASGKINRVN